MKITTLKEFQDKFNSELNKVNDKQKLIEAELKDIDEYLNENVMIKADRKGLFSSRIRSKQYFGLDIINVYRERFSKEVHDFNIYGKVLGSDSLEKEVIKDISKQAIEFSKYIDWLRGLNREYNSKPQQKEYPLSLNQRLLALHYLGLDLSKYENTNSAEILSQILGFGTENIRKSLSYLSAGRNKVRTKGNFEALIKLFGSQGFDDVSDKIKKDSEKL